MALATFLTRMIKAIPMLKTLVAGAAFAALISTTTSAQDMTAFVGVNVLPMDRETVLEDQTVLVKDGVITAIGPRKSIKVPRKAERINGKDKTLMPGLSDMHTHIYPCTRDDPYGACSIPEHQFALYAATGVTLVRDTAGNDGHFEHRKKLENGTWFGPDFVFTSNIFEGEKAVWDFGLKVLTPEKGRALVQEHAEKGYHAIKIYHTISIDVFEAVIAAGKEFGIPIMGHVPFDVGIDAAIENHMASIEHMRGYDFDGVDVASLWRDGGRSAERFGSWLTMTDERMDELVDKTVKYDVANVPTFIVNRMLYDKAYRRDVAKHPRMSLLHPALRKQINGLNSLDVLFPPPSREALRAAFPVMKSMLVKLQAAGGSIMTGTDTPAPGFVQGYSVIDEIKIFKQAGLTNYQALYASTFAPAKFLKMDNTHGAVSVGRKANLILLGASPLEDLENLWALEGTMISGEWQSMDEMMNAMENKAAAYAEVKAELEKTKG